MDRNASGGGGTQSLGEFEGAVGIGADVDPSGCSFDVFVEVF